MKMPLNALILVLLTSSTLVAQQKSLLDVVERIFQDSLNYSTRQDSVITKEIPGNNKHLVIGERPSILPGTRPLILINGILIENASILGVVNSEKIKQVQVLSDRRTTAALYGVRGIHGAVLITVDRRTARKIRRVIEEK